MARFLRTLLRNDPEDITMLDLLYELPDAPACRAYVVHGDESHPAQIDLYKSQRPEYNERPVATYVREGGQLTLQTKENQ